MQDSIKDRATRMAREGRTATDISKELGISYLEVWNLVPATWQGTKTMITRRMNQIVKETDSDAREQLVHEVKEQVDFLYQSGRQLGRMVASARKTLSS